MCAHVNRDHFVTVVTDNISPDFHRDSKQRLQHIQDKPSTLTNLTLDVGGSQDLHDSTPDWQPGFSRQTPGPPDQRSEEGEDKLRVF